MQNRHLALFGLSPPARSYSQASSKPRFVVAPVPGRFYREVNAAGHIAGHKAKRKPTMPLWRIVLEHPAIPRSDEVTYSIGTPTGRPLREALYAPKLREGAKVLGLWHRNMGHYLPATVIKASPDSKTFDLQFDPMHPTWAANDPRLTLEDVPLEEVEAGTVYRNLQPVASFRHLLAQIPLMWPEATGKVRVMLGDEEVTPASAPSVWQLQAWLDGKENAPVLEVEIDGKRIPLELDAAFEADRFPEREKTEPSAKGDGWLMENLGLILVYGLLGALGIIVVRNRMWTFVKEEVQANHTPVPKDFHQTGRKPRRHRLRPEDVTLEDLEGL